MQEENCTFKKINKPTGDPNSHLKNTPADYPLFFDVFHFPLSQILSFSCNQLSLAGECCPHTLSHILFALCSRHPPNPVCLSVPAQHWAQMTPLSPVLAVNDQALQQRSAQLPAPSRPWGQPSLWVITHHVDADRTLNGIPTQISDPLGSDSWPCFLSSSLLAPQLSF